MRQKFRPLELEEMIHFFPQTTARARVDALEGDERNGSVAGNHLRIVYAGITFIG